MKYDPSSLKWGIVAGNSQLIAAFDDKATATQFHSTLQSSQQFKGQNLQIVDTVRGEPVREQTGDRIGA